MLLEDSADATTTLSYWLNWRFFLCAICVFAPIAVAFWMIWRYEVKDQLQQSREETPQDKNWLQSYEAWRPCLREIHPIWLLAFRLFAFCLLLASLIVKALITGPSMFFYYTQWTFTLLAIYFACGSLVSMYGIFHYHETRSRVLNAENSMEEGEHAPLLSGKPSSVIRGNKVLESHEQSFTSRAAGICSYVFKVLFQINAGAVILTDCIYWFIIYPFLTIKDYDVNFMTINLHMLNVVLLLGDTSLNSMRLPWFGISFFFIWTGLFVISQWIIHAFVSIGWPYPFLDLSAPYAPLWYLLMGLMHIPSYCTFILILKLKHYLMLKWFPL